MGRSLLASDILSVTGMECTSDARDDEGRTLLVGALPIDMKLLFTDVTAAAFDTSEASLSDSHDIILRHDHQK